MVDLSSVFPVQTDYERGGFWRRALALLIDLILVCLMLQVLAFVAYPATGGRIQFRDGLAMITCSKLDKAPDGVTVPADFAPTSIKACRTGLFALTAARTVVIQHSEQHGAITTTRDIIVEVDEAGQVVKGPGLGILSLPLFFGFRLLLDLGRGTPGRRILRLRLASARGEVPPRAAHAIKRYALQALPVVPLFLPGFAGLIGYEPKPEQAQPIVIGTLVCLGIGLCLALHTIIYRKETYYDRLAGVGVLHVDRDGAVMPRAAPAPSLLPPEIMDPMALPEEMPAMAMPPPLPPEPARNYVVKHWRGEFSLPFAYWVNGTLLGSVFGIVAGLVIYAATAQLIGMPMMWFASLAAVWLAIILFTIWHVTGVWRSATRYRAGGKRFWGGFAKCLMVCVGLGLSYRVIATALPQLRDVYNIARGDAMVGSHSFYVALDGARLDFYGGITFGVAKELDEQLAGMDHVTTVLLNSQGGRIAEAQRMADIIRKRGLSTTVVNLCASACTIAFLGGKERTMTATARLGFHQPNFGGLSSADRLVLIAQEEARLQRFGLSKAFAVRANQAAPQSMWYPDKAELLREHVVTAIIEPQPQPKSQPRSTEKPVAIGTVPVRAAPTTTAPVATLPQQWQPSKADAPKPIATLPVREPPATAAPAAPLPQPPPAPASAKPRARIPTELIERLSKPPPKASANATTAAPK